MAKYHFLGHFCRAPLKATQSQVSHMASDQVHHLRVQSMWEGNGSSGDELTMITPAPSKSLKLGSTTDSKANSGYVSDTQQPETVAQGDKAEEIREADATPPLEERQPDLMSEEQVEPRASATEEPETAAQVDKAEETREADATGLKSVNELVGRCWFICSYKLCTLYIYIKDTCFDTHMHIHFIMGIGL